ncbi:Thiamin-phosphate pyrophosphorylase [hydrothermal vent metagenome]|uniref:Thiamin-phosphate pyrophosphorylase n=1 Tax=hydrothermal vent metagenome TaxID=652676 RepID=A0A3B0RIT7_9ZZZZ
MSAATTSSYCRLFLATPDCFDPADLKELLAAAISGGDIASLLIRHQDADKLREAAMAVTQMAQAAGIAVLIENDVETAKICGADGVQLDGAGPNLHEAREQLGSDKIIGVFCGNERHSAMAAGEAGADYVAFDNAAADGESEPIAHWWARVFEVPCVVIEPLAMEQASAGVASRVDFICPPHSMWANKQAASETVRGYNAMIKETPIETV